MVQREDESYDDFHRKRLEIWGLPRYPANKTFGKTVAFSFLSLSSPCFYCFYRRLTSLPSRDIRYDRQWLTSICVIYTECSSLLFPAATHESFILPNTFDILKFDPLAPLRLGTVPYHQ